MTPRAELSSTIQETIPSRSRRYDDYHAGHSKKRIIPVGPIDVREGDNDASLPFGSVPEGWNELIHVIEGLPFFYNPKLKVITDAYIRIPALLAQVEFWHAQISQALQFIDNIDNQLSTMDIYIDPLQDPRTGQKKCAYYLVDHTRCTLAFLRRVETSTIGLPDVRSTIHLERVLRCEYWTHFEYMPRPDVDHSVSARKLQAQLAALMIDNISSEGSTSPFTPNECERYIQAIEKSCDAEYLNWTISRIYALLLQSQIINLHGEQRARADRMMIVSGQHASVRSAAYLQRSKLMFDWPGAHLARLEYTWTDRVIYSHHWKKLLEQLIEEWIAAAWMIGLVWISNMVLFSTVSSPIFSLILVISTAFSVFGAAKALFLIRTHRALGQFALHGSQYFQSHEKCGTGLQNLSFEYSYPWACALWAGGLTTLVMVWAVLTEVIASLLNLALSVGFIPSYVAFTGLLMAGAWAYGRGVSLNPSKIVSIMSTPQCSQ
ncbi:hypothetical protein CTheo_2892 [Ceratobasidium theobromae]|uniref:Transmembrane protein n=1 Tax=Ceratobasidium theobromae TaxID=1582974 RepID=A0A5N5QPY8_9AGAM|nr:hypothetical protein CTheo_2892 [Ceratobasidium theobromae]